MVLARRSTTRGQREGVLGHRLRGLLVTDVHREARDPDDRQRQTPMLGARRAFKGSLELGHSLVVAVRPAQELRCRTPDQHVSDLRDQLF